MQSYSNLKIIWFYLLNDNVDHKALVESWRFERQPFQVRVKGLRTTDAGLTIETSAYETIYGEFIIPHWHSTTVSLKTYPFVSEHAFVLRS